MSARTKHLKVLGLDEKANEATIKKAFKKLALLYHPDRNSNNVEEATERFKQINEANTYLTSAAGRVRTPPSAPEPAPTRPPPRRRPPAPHRPPPSEKPKPKPTEEEADLKRAQRHHAQALKALLVNPQIKTRKTGGGSHNEHLGAQTQACHTVTDVSQQREPKASSTPR